MWLELIKEVVHELSKKDLAYLKEMKEGTFPEKRGQTQTVKSAQGGVLFSSAFSLEEDNQYRTLHEFSLEEATCK